MRYYLYQDRDLIRNIYAQELSVRFDLESIEYIGEKSASVADKMQLKPDVKMCEGDKIRVGADFENLNSESVTTLSAYANMEDVREIYQSRFYHRLIEDIRCNRSKEDPCFVCSKGRSNLCNTSTEARDKFVFMNNMYIWLNQEKLSCDIEVFCNVTDEIEMVGYIIKNGGPDYPTIIKAVALYIG